MEIDNRDGGDDKLVIHAMGVDGNIISEIAGIVLMELDELVPMVKRGCPHTT